MSFPSALTVFSAAVQGGLGRAGGDVEEAIHEERSVRQEGVLRPLIQSGEIWEQRDVRNEPDWQSTFIVKTVLLDDCVHKEHRQ